MVHGVYTARCNNKTVYHVRPHLDSHSLLCHTYLKLVIALHTSLSDAQYLEVNLP